MVLTYLGLKYHVIDIYGINIPGMNIAHFGRKFIRDPLSEVDPFYRLIHDTSSELFHDTFPRGEIF